jgi:Amt family ammonium transporter
MSLVSGSLGFHCHWYLGVCACGGDGLIYDVDQFLAQLAAIAVVVPFAFVGSYVLLKVINKVSPIRVDPAAEDAGLDLSEHGEEAYQLD